ncbi:T9SS type A sorting domain-containing protein [Botryobacter ruber]|uniref:T9SS type A sorting domain-containing protein n=1 Tax=Botryobacter ruber TaxID=2171629 RepID=UPI0013E2CC9A|nr:T9SS type A sorting domain-containing protein [Botryobacter ruber]
MKTFTISLILVLLLHISVAAQTTVFPYNSTWSYLDNGTNQGTAWRATSFDDSSWKTGTGKFGYGESGLSTTVNYGSDSKNKYITTYFRKTITIADISAFASFTGSMYRDDGLVVYVNGVEVHRSSMPTGTVSYTTLAYSPDDDGHDEQTFTISSSYFTSGTNVIAVELHQSKLNSSDLIFDLALSATAGTSSPVDETAPTLVSINRQSPSTQTTSATAVVFRATFSEAVTGVDAGDFTFTKISGTVSGTVSAVAGVGTDGKAYDITVSSITGEGELRLDLKPSGTGIADAASNAISGGFTSGQTYIIQQTTTEPVVDNATFPFKSGWKYLDNGTNQGTAWRATSFDDSSWKTGTGKFGYGESGLSTTVNYGPDSGNKYITTYFRKAVNVADISAYSSFAGSMYCDDGMVVYVNGVEVYRYNLSGTVTYTTLAAGASDDGRNEHAFTISPSAFVNGTNVLAVEVHQSKASSSDIVFDLALTGVTGTPPATDVTRPVVESINRQSPTTQTTSATAVTFRVTFSEKVNNVDRGDFTVTRTSGSVSGTLASNAMATVGTDGTTYDLTVSSISGEGTLRLDLKSSGTGIVDAAGNAISGGFTNGQTYTIQQQVAQGPGFTSVTDLTPLSVSKNTADKPQSKPWSYAGKHWAVLPNSSGTHIWRLDGTTWTRVLEIASGTNSKADCKVVGNVVHILLYRGASSNAYVVSAEYVPETQTYKLWSKRTSAASFSLESGAETATLDMDGNGRMWVVYDGTSNVNVRWSDSPYSSWSSPIVVASGITDDDIAAIIAMPGKIGVLWSNQNTERFGFRTHTDGASPTDWGTDEAPASNEAKDVGAGLADDHLNMAVASDGTLYCAVKTGYDRSGYPKLALLVRRPSGSWDKLYEVSQSGTRSIVILNERIGRLRVIYTEVEDGGDILYRESATANISFGSAITLIKGNYNNPTSIKANFSSEVVILASTSSEAVGVLARDGDAGLSASSTAGATAARFGEVVQGELLAYPNPFVSDVTITYVLPEEGEYTLALYDSKGALVSVIGQGMARAGEQQTVKVNGANLASGLYFVRLQTVKGAQLLKLVVER